MQLYNLSCVTLANYNRHKLLALRVFVCFSFTRCPCTWLAAYCCGWLTLLTVLNMITGAYFIWMPHDDKMGGVPIFVEYFYFYVFFIPTSAYYTVST